jgi:hypothetical protein
MGFIVTLIFSISLKARFSLKAILVVWMSAMWTTVRSVARPGITRS